VDKLAHRHGRLDGVEEANELAIAMALHAATEDGALQDVEGREQGRGVVVGVVSWVWASGCPSPRGRPDQVYSRAWI
jgi:hypothetical protein